MIPLHNKSKDCIKVSADFLYNTFLCNGAPTFSFWAVITD